MELKTALFNVSAADKKIPHTADLEVNKRGLPAYKSKIRKPADEEGSVKLSRASVAIALLVDHSISVGRCGATAKLKEGYYSECTKDGMIYSAYCDGSQLLYCTSDAKTLAPIPDPPFTSEHVGALVAYCVFENSEAEQCMKEIIEDYRLSLGISTVKPIYTLSDNVFYTVKYSGMTRDYLNIDDVDQVEDVTARFNSKGAPGSFMMVHEYGAVSAASSSDPTAAHTPYTSSPGSLPPFLQKCYDGDFVVDLPWTAEQRQKIPSRDCFLYFVSSVRFERLVKRFYAVLSWVADQLKIGTSPRSVMLELGHRKDVLNELLYGPPGTGKSFTVEALGAALGMPVYTVGGSAHMEEGAITGEYGYSGGVIKYVMQTVTKVFRDGGLLEFAEINLTDPAVTAKMNSILESPFVLDTADPDEPIIERSPMAAIVGTMNVSLAGCKEMNEAFISRFNKAKLDAPTTKQFTDMLVSNTGCSVAQAEQMLRLFKKLREFLDKNFAEKIQLSMREVYRTLHFHLVYGYPLVEAAEDCFCSTIEILSDMELAEKAGREVIRAVLV